MEPNIITEVNACLGRDVHATQGPYTESGRLAAQAVDGVLDQRTNFASVQDRSENSTAWWSIDLGYRRSIVNLTVLWADNTGDSVRTIKRRYGYEIYVSNFPDPKLKKGSLCYRDTDKTSPAPPRISLNSCRIPSRYIRLYNTRPTNVSTDASKWPNLEITEVIAMIETGNQTCLAGQFGWDCQLSCHCAATEQCDTSNGDCPGDCAEGWAGPKCQIRTENVAEGKQAAQTGTKDDYEAKFAVDGTVNQQTNYSHAFTRVENDTVWWEVVLGSVEKIQLVRVYFAKPDSSYAKKLRGVSLKVFNSSDADAVGDECYRDTSGPSGTPPDILNLTDCSSGSIVRLFNSRNTAQDTTVYSKYPQLLISEVQVMADKGCSNGTYGSECDKVCDRCQDKACNRDDGTCGKCLPGWYGNSCQQQCSASCPSNTCVKNTGYCTGTCDPGFYGNWCNKTCSPNCPNNTCVKDTGYCTGACEPGFYGNWCNETCSTDCEQGCKPDSGKCVACPPDKYGDFCEQTCSTNCKVNCSGRLCDRKTGHCTCGCKERKFGKTCDDNCPINCIQCDSFDSCSTCKPEHWGMTCEKPCAIDCLNQYCNKYSGKCWGCDGSKYGDQCELECPSNCEGNRCYQNGTCLNGCKDKSFYGDMCDLRCSHAHPSCTECQQNSTGDIECLSCVDGRHGLKCEHICPDNCKNCRNDSLCTQCEGGWTGELCDTPCHVQHCSECNINGTCRVCVPGRYGHDCQSECSDCETCIPDSSKKDGYSCLSCKKGKYLHELLGLCIPCQSNCVSCVSRKNCTSCKDGFHGSECSKKCPENCVSCLSETECTSCNTSWTGKECKCNMKHCIIDSDLSKWCTMNGTCLKGCIKGFWGASCEFKCVSNCLSCEQISGQCLKCAAGRYGADCRENCSANCADKDIMGVSICKLSDGSCNFCDRGWYGNKCDMPCNPNCLMSGGAPGCHQRDGDCENCKGDKWGPSCSKDCAQNCHDRLDLNSCYKADGSCKFCEDGFRGIYCNYSCSANCKTSCDRVTGGCDECKSGFYGRLCEERCPSNCGKGRDSKMIVCNRFTGECLFCKEGFHGEICNLPCSKFCSQGTIQPVCKKADGHCLSCQPGYHGNHCDGECNEHCGIADDRDVKVGLCDMDTSLCLHGCVDGWYNSTCLDRCNSKCRGEKCEIDDGKCSEGCVPGYKGDFCNVAAQTDDSATAGIIGGVIAALVVVVVVIILFIILRRRYFGRPVRKGSNTRVHKRSVKNGITSDEIIPLYANVNGANRLPLPARNTTKATVEEEVLADGDDTTPLMGSDRQASDYYNLSSLIPVTGFADYVHGRQVLTANWYKDDFAKLPRGLLKNCMVAVSPANRGKCRYKNLYPYDDSRVILEPDGNEKTDFINASYIHGYQTREAFIAAQGPTEQNVNDFWRMIWQKDCGKIVMLTNLYEDCKLKCVKYWPDDKETEQYGNLDVELDGEEVFSDYTLRHLKVSHKLTREEKDFKHFHFTAWPDRGVPENAGALLHFRDKVNEATGVPDGPLLVHCSAGIGRTGTFIVIDYLIRQAKAESHLDVFRTVTDMRYQRANFVQTDIQYEFVHKALIEALTTKEMEVSAADFCRYYWGLMEDRSEYSNQTKLAEQYETLNEMSATLDESCFTSGRLPENVGKNRYPDIIPVDTYRAYLSTPVTGSNEYINAVFLPTCLNKSAFLLTQMPLPHTVTDFWRLVYDQHVSTIVMMNNINDDDDETIGEYWPFEDSTYGPFKIELLSCENHDDYAIMAMKLTYISSSRQDSMTVRQYRFESWPDGELLPTSTKALVSLAEAVNQSPKGYKDESVIVHCMNGNDRSGLFCTVSSIMTQLRTQHKVNIPQTILQLRRRRPQLIPNLEQYDFCHRALSEHLDDTQIYSNVM